MTDARGARIVRIIQDPELGGDLLLLAVGLSAIYDFGLPYNNGIWGMGEMFWAGSPDPRWKIKETFRADMRTYRPERMTDHHCTFPVARRDGVCGRNASQSGYLTDWATGEKMYGGGCSRHRLWFGELHRANWRAKPDVVPLPCANHGGRLARHFPRIDWQGFWRRLDSTWVEHPEAKPWPKPDLSLVLGDGDGGPVVAPLLSVVPIGGVS